MDKDKSSFPTQEIVKKEYSLLWQEQRALIRCDHPLSEEEVRLAVQVARTHSIPISALALVPSGGGFKLYVTVEGILWKVHNDPRGLESIEPEVIQWASEENTGIAKAKCTITFGGGRRFVEYAQHSKAGELDPAVTIDRITNKCIDLALQRACSVAIGVPLPIYQGE